MRRTRLAVLLVVLVGLLFVALPNASASATFRDGVGYCDDIAGRDVCVHALSDECILWASAGFGGCWIPR